MEMHLLEMFLRKKASSHLPLRLVQKQPGTYLCKKSRHTDNERKGEVEKRDGATPGTTKQPLLLHLTGANVLRSDQWRVKPFAT